MVSKKCHEKKREYLKFSTYLNYVLNNYVHSGWLNYVRKPLCTFESRSNDLIEPCSWVVCEIKNPALRAVILVHNSQFLKKLVHISLFWNTKVCREGTRAQTTRINQTRSDKQQVKNVGSIKLFSIKLAFENEWNAEKFKLEKSELRKLYQVARKEPPSEIANLDTYNLLSYLKENSTYRNFTNYT